MEMSIAAMSITMHQQSLQNAVQTSMLKKTMDSEAQAMQTLLQGFENANPAPPTGSVGSVFDVRA